MSNDMKESGFTYIEIVIYMGLLVVFLQGLVIFHKNIAVLSVTSRVAQDLTSTIEHVEKRMSYEIRNASGVNTMTSSSLCLSSPDPLRNPTFLYVQDNRIRIGWGGGSTVCSNLTHDYPLTSSRVRVSGFTFQNLSNTVTRHIHYRYVVSYATGGQRKEWSKTQVASGSAEIRAF